MTDRSSRERRLEEACYVSDSRQKRTEEALYKADVRLSIIAKMVQNNLQQDQLPQECMRELLETLKCVATGSIGAERQAELIRQMTNDAMRRQVEAQSGRAA